MQKAAGVHVHAGVVDLREAWCVRGRSLGRGCSDSGVVASSQKGMRLFQNLNPPKRYHSDQCALLTTGTFSRRVRERERAREQVLDTQSFRFTSLSCTSKLCSSSSPSQAYIH